MQITNSSPFLFPVVREDQLIRIKAFIKYGSPLIYPNKRPLPESEYGKILYENRKFFVAEYQVINTNPYTIEKLFVDLITKEPLEQTIPFIRAKNKQYTTDGHPVIKFVAFLRKYDLVYADGIEAGKSIPKNAIFMQDQNGNFYFENHPLIAKNTYSKRQLDKKPVYAEGEKAGKPIPTPKEVQQDKEGNSYILENNKKQFVITSNQFKMRKRTRELVRIDTGKKITKEDEADKVISVSRDEYYRYQPNRLVYARGENAGKNIDLNQTITKIGRHYYTQTGERVAIRSNFEDRRRKRLKENNASEMPYQNEILNFSEQLVNAIQNSEPPTTPDTFPSTPSSFWNEDYIGSLPLFPSSPKQDAVKKPEETMEDSNKIQGSKNTCKIM